MKEARKSTYTKHVLLSAYAGTQLIDCLQEAVVLSAQEKVDVVLLFNDKEYKIAHERLLNTVECKE